jgi:CheY-like chemotaxis protein
MSEVKTILCIDDDSDFLFAIRAVLEKNGYKVLEAASAEEGMAAFDSGHPDMVIVDMMMEEVDAGLAFVQAVRAKKESLPVYLFSSVGDNLSGMTSYEDLGFNGVLQKPIDSQILMSTVRSCIG